MYRGVINGKAGKAAALTKFSDMLTLSLPRGQITPRLALPHPNFNLDYALEVVRDGGVTWQPPPARWLAVKSQPSITKFLNLELHATSFKILFAY